MRAHAARLSPGDDLLSGIENLVSDHKIEAGVILSAVGGLGDANLRLAGARSALELHGEFEIVSATGTVSAAGWHVHVAIADDTGQAFGGHLLQGCIVRTTAELVIGVIDGVRFERVHDPNTGFNELRIS